MLSDGTQPAADRGRPRHEDGRAAAPLLAADRRGRRTRRQPHQAGAAARRRPCAVQGSVRPVWSAGTPLSASQRRPSAMASSKRAACAATTMAGGSTRPVPAASSRSRTSTRRRSASATRSASAPIASRRRRVCSGRISVRSPHRCCRTGSRSAGTTASCRSCSPWCRATGSSARRTRSTRCISSGCTTTGDSAWRGTTAHIRRAISSWRSMNSSTGWSIAACARTSDETSQLWTVGRVCLWPNALFTGNHFEWRVPIDDTNTLSVGWFFTRVPKDREPYRAEQHSVLVLADHRREDRAVDHQPHHEPGLCRLGRPGCDHGSASANILGAATAASS